MPQESLPPCLRWPEDRDARRALALQLPLRLFAELRQLFAKPAPLAPSEVHTQDRCLQFLAKRNIPDPFEISAAWQARPKQLLRQSKDVSDETMSAWIEAYASSWGWEFTPDEAKFSSQNSYVLGCYALLTGNCRRFSVPIATVDGHRLGRIQMLHLDVANALAEGLYVHPEFEFARQYLDADFLSSIETAWQLAADGATNQSLVFWHITEADSTPIIDRQKSGRSASAAAYRAFWHIRRKLSLDDEVYVLASCAKGDGDIEDVGGLSAKIKAIQHYREANEQKAPATIALAAHTSNRSAHDEAAIKHASTWAEFTAVPTTEALIAVRSCTTNAAITYLKHLTDRLDKTPWQRAHERARLSEVYVPAHVWREERQLSGLFDPAGGEGPDLRHESCPALERNSPTARVSWQKEFECTTRTTPLVVIGGPGFGKTALLRWTARQMAESAIKAIETRVSSCNEVAWPFLTDLDSWASTDGSARDSLKIASLLHAPPPAAWPDQYHLRSALDALLRDRLGTHRAHTFLFLDSLDQLSEVRGQTLHERLSELADFAPRMVISTRESGLRTHYHITPFAHVTLLRCATLSRADAHEVAVKWMGPQHALQLESHLRSHLSLSTIADSPLLLTLACLVQTIEPDKELPETPAELYREMMRFLARGTWRRGPAAAPLPNAEPLLDSLQLTAWAIFSRDPGTNRFDRHTLLEAIIRTTGRTQVDASAFITTLCDLGFLESSGKDADKNQFHFRHASFLEFLAALHLASNVNNDGWNVAEVDAWEDLSGWETTNVETLLDMKAFEPAWEAIYPFVVGLLKDPSQLIRALIDPNRDDFFKHRSRLAMRCICEMGPQHSGLSRDILNLIGGDLCSVEQMFSSEGLVDSSRLTLLKSLMASPDGVAKLTTILREVLDRFNALRRKDVFCYGDQEVIEMLEIVAGLPHGQEAKKILREFAMADRGCVGIWATRSAVKLALRGEEREQIAFWESQLERSPHRYEIAEEFLGCGNPELRGLALQYFKQIATDSKLETWRREIAIESVLGSSAYIPDDDFEKTVCAFLFGPVLERFRNRQAEKWELLSLCGTNGELLRQRLTHLVNMHSTADQRTAGFATFREVIRDDRYDLYARNDCGIKLGDEHPVIHREVEKWLQEELSKPLEGSGQPEMSLIVRMIWRREPISEDLLSLIQKYLATSEVFIGWKAFIAAHAKRFGYPLIVGQATQEVGEFMRKVRDAGAYLMSDFFGLKDCPIIFEGTAYGNAFFKSALERARSDQKMDYLDREMLLQGATSSELLSILESLPARGHNYALMQDAALKTLDERGWRLRLGGEKWRLRPLWQRPLDHRRIILQLREGVEAPQLSFR